MKLHKNIDFKLRDLIPIYGVVKDFSEHKDMYFKPIKDLPDNFVADLALKVSFLYAYNFGVVEGLRRIIFEN